MDHFWVAIRKCPDVTQNAFPFLYRNRKERNTGKATLRNLVSHPQKQIMLFVVRLHYATAIMAAMQKDNGAFNFKTFPLLKDVFMQLEYDLHNKSVGKDRLDRSIERKMRRQSKDGRKLKQITIFRFMISKVKQNMQINFKKLKRELNETIAHATALSKTYDAVGGEEEFGAEFVKQVADVLNSFERK